MSTFWAYLLIGAGLLALFVSTLYAGIQDAKKEFTNDEHGEGLE